MSKVLNYHWDLKTKEYTKSSEATYSKKGKLLPVYGATTMAPLDPKEGFAVIWNGSAWAYTEDHRQKQDAMKGKVGGTPYWLPGDDYKTQARYMTEIGPLPEGALLERPKEPIEITKQNKKYELNSSYQMSLNGSVEVDGMTINASEAAYKDIDNLIANYTDPVSFRLFDNTHQTVFKPVLESFKKSVYDFLQSKRELKWDYQAKIDACTTHEELEQLTFVF